MGEAVKSPATSDLGRRYGGDRVSIRLVCLDMAGTTVVDDGAVEDAFVQTMVEQGVAAGSAELAGALDVVHRTMGQSKIVVFRELFADEARAQAANAGFERAYEAGVSRGSVAALPGAADLMGALRDAGVAVCLTTGFAPSTRQAIVESLGWGGRVDLALSPADAGRGRPFPDMVLTAMLRLEVDDVRHVAVAGDTANDLLAGWRAGAGVVAGVLTGAHDRATLEAAPHTHILDTIADLAPLVLGPD
ncbi:phosphonatase-like hydrolase [soil metagenome]